MEGYKCPKCYKVGLRTSFISNHICIIEPIKPNKNINAKPISIFNKLLINENPIEIIGNLVIEPGTLESER